MSSLEVTPETRRGRNRLAVSVVLGHTIKHIYNSGLALILPEIKMGLGLSLAQFGSLATARSVAAGLSTIAAGFLGDRFSNKAGLMLGVSLSLMGLSYLAAGHAPNYWVMLVVMLLVGIGPSMYHPPAISALSRRFPDRRGFAISLHGTGGIAGEVLGPLVVAGALGIMMWRDVLKTSTAPALVAAFLVWVTIRSLPTREETGVTSLREYFASLANLLGNRMLVILVAAVALRSIGEGAIEGFLPVYLRDDLALSAIRVGIYLSSAQVAGLVAQPLMGYLSDRYGRNAVLLPVTAAVGLLALALSVATPGLQLFVIVVVKGAFKFSLHHIYVAAAIDAARGHAQSTVVSLIYSAGLIGVFSPYVAGLISDSYGIHSAFVYGGSVLLLPTLLLFMLKLPRPGTELGGASGR